MSVPADLSRLRVEGRAPTRVRSCCASSSETAAERLTDDLLLEILPRVPAKSLCRCRCVSKHWRSLIDHPNLRKKLPRTLAGFFYRTTFFLDKIYRTTSTSSVPETFQQPPVVLASVPGIICPLMISTSLAFLPKHQRLDVLDCCNGLLLCRLDAVSTQIGQLCYVVCNPATEKWVALTDSGHGYNVHITRLGFDPAQSSYFHVFELFDGPGVAVYSSETGGWVHKKFNQPFTLPFRYHQSVDTVFLNNRLHFHVSGFDSANGIAAVDTEVETWTNFGVPGHGQVDGFIQCSQGRMHYANFYVDEVEDTFKFRLAVYVLKNYESKEWMLKHMVDPFDIFGEIDRTFEWDFELVGIHPECNLIFFTRGRDEDTRLVCYEMDFEQVKVIRTIKDGEPPYLPYVPLYAELQALHM